MDIMTLAAAKSYTDKKIDNGGGAVDLSNYYTKQEINNKNFTTSQEMREYVTAAINGSLDEIGSMIDEIETLIESGVLDNES